MQQQRGPAESGRLDPIDRRSAAAVEGRIDDLNLIRADQRVDRIAVQGRHPNGRLKYRNWDDEGFALYEAQQARVRR